MKKLLIDTSDRTKSIIALEVDDKKFEEVIESDSPHSEKILSSIEKVCKDANVHASRIDEITVKQGPGSFTGLRVGIAIANALALATSARINEKEFGVLAEPVYS